MLQTIHTINVLLPILYLVTLLLYLGDFLKDNQTFRKSKSILLFVTLIIHTFYLFSRTVEFNHFPFTNKFEVFTLLACSIAFSYFLLELITDIKGTGVFIIIFAFIFQLISSLFIEDLLEVKEVLQNRFLGSHVVSAIWGYAGFTISAVYGVLFLVLYKKIKASKFDLIYNRLPNLETMEKLSFDSLLIGFSLLTVAIIIGFTWLPSAFEDFSYFDPKIISSSLVWLIYAAGIAVKLFSGWYGKKVIRFSLTGFVIAILSLLLGNVFASSFHSFY